MPGHKGRKSNAWRTPDNPARTKQAAKSTKSINTAPDVHSLPLELQQIILNVFSIAFPLLQDTEELTKVLQKVKGHLFNRDFAAAFSEQTYLQAYALRWSAARALGYTHILTSPDRDYLLVPPNGSRKPARLSGEQEEQGDVGLPNTSKLVCIGGGAGAEIAALAAAQRARSHGLEVIAVDSADWSQPVTELATALVTPPMLSVHYSEAARARPENQPLLTKSAQVNISFMHQDVLTWKAEALQPTLRNTTLCTIMFTLNELFSASLPKTTSFLLSLTAAMPKDSHLLVVDSPGSYSEIQLGKTTARVDTSEDKVAPTKKYPMKWLLDHTLLEVAKDGDQAAWEKVESEDSLWFRIEQKDRVKLRYPIELENMRYQLHCYRRL